MSSAAAAGAAVLSSVVAASSVIPQGYASPYIDNLISSDRPLVAASTERSLRGVDVRIRGVPHRYIGRVGASLVREVLVGPEVHPRRARPVSLENPSRPPWIFYRQLSALKRRPGPGSNLRDKAVTLLAQASDGA